MHPAKRALIRCETLDLFEPSATRALAPSPTEPGCGEGQTSEPGFLFRIGPDDQLDLFRHSAAEMAAAAARQALKEHAADRARRHLSLLGQAPAYRQFFADGRMCLELIERRDPRWHDPAQAVPWIETELQPAAQRCLLRDAGLLVRPALLALIGLCEQRPFDPDRRHVHPAYLWQLLGEPVQAVAALELDLQWRDQMPALIWHAELSEQALFAERVSADVVELCLAWPDAAESWLSASRTWARRWSAWCELDDTLPVYAFPAWCRLTRATEFPSMPTNDERPGAQLLRIADLLVRNTGDLQWRKALNARCPELLAAFLAERTQHAVAARG